MQINVISFVRDNFQYFKDAFTSEQDMLDYWKKFLTTQNKVNASPFHDFYEIVQYYQAMKQVKDEPSKLIMIISLIEKLNSEADYKTFPEWLTEQKSGPYDKKGIKRLFNAYNDQFGCSRKFRNFFKGDYLTKAEKITLLQSIKNYVSNSDCNSSQHLMPMFCYDSKSCYYKNTLISCPISLLNFDKKDCLICNDSNKLTHALDELAEFLYYMRNKFAHDAYLPRLAPPIKPIKHEDGATMTMTTFSSIHYRFRRKKPDYLGWICIELNIKDIEQMLDRNLKCLLDNYIDYRK